MAQEIAIPRKLWEHPNPKSTRIWRFMQDANKKRGLNMQVCYPDLYSIFKHTILPLCLPIDTTLDFQRLVQLECWGP